MNPYFEENDNRFRQAIETSHRDGYPCRERFTAIDPSGDQVFLRFKPGHKNDIEVIYRSLDVGVYMIRKHWIFGLSLLLKRVNHFKRAWSGLWRINSWNPMGGFPTSLHPV